MSEQLHQQLNEQLRDALLALCLTYAVPEDSNLLGYGISTADDLYAWWLLDMQVSQAVPTTRVASAIASLQQYINAISLGLEPGYETRGMSAAQHAHWRDSLNAYSLWRTVQQLRHFPANYLNPMLRSHKTDSFQQLENDINQCRIQSDSVLPAIQRYLTRFEEIANLKTLNGYIDGDKDNFASSTYYFVGRSNVDNTYYWRSLDMSRRGLQQDAGGVAPYKLDTPQPVAWSDWKKISLPASGNIPEHSVRPVYFNNRLFVVWAQCLSPAAGSNSSEYSWSDPGESEKSYKTRLESFLKSRFIQFRLCFTYLNYDGSWSVPQVCSDEYCVMKELNKLDMEALKQATQTVAVLDSTTQPPSLFLGLNAHAPLSRAVSKDHSRSDYFQAVRIDQSFAQKHLFSRGTVADMKSTPEHEKLAKRYLSLFIYNNHQNLNFHAPASETIAVTGMLNSTPNPVPAGWNFDGMQAYISDQSMAGDIVFNATSCVLEVTTRLAREFPAHQSVTFKASTRGGELTLDLTLLRPPTGGHSKPMLQNGSVLTINSEISPPCNWISLSITCLKTGLVYSGLIHERADSAAGTVQPLLARPVRLDWEVDLKGKYIEYDAFNFMFENTNTDYRIAVHFHAEANSPADPQKDWLFDHARATLYARHYKPVIITPRHEDTPHPHKLHRGNSQIVGAPNTSRRELNGSSLSLDPAQPFSAHIQLNPKTLRPHEEQSSGSTGSARPITIIHGVLIFDTDTRHNDRIIRGYALKAFSLTLNPGDSATAPPLAPRITRGAAQAEGTAEFIDFSGSIIQYSDNTLVQTPRLPVRMNTEVSRQLSAAASVSLDRLFSMTASQWREPALPHNTAPAMLDFHGAHGKYFWELFLYLPWLVAWRLNMEQRYAEAQAWLTYLFDPTRTTTDPRQGPDYWKLHALTPTTAEPGYAQYTPDDPNQIALSTPVHFRQALYMLYLDILFNRGDAAYRQTSADSLAEAKLWYVRINHLLGPRPVNTDADPWEPMTLHELSTSEASVLCRPLNPDLEARRDKIESRLYNLRNHLSITGKPLHLPVYAPAQPPRSLLTHYARSAGSSNGSTANMPLADIGHYRFAVVYAQAMGLVENVIQLGSTLLLLFERQDQNELMQLQQQHAWDLARIALDQQLQGMTVDATNHMALLASRQVIEGRVHYFEKLLKEGISAAESRASQHYLESAQWDRAASAAQASAGMAMLAPNIFGTSNGGMRFEGAFHAIQAVAQGVANDKRSNANHLDRTELFNRRAQEWRQALEQCRLELNQLDVQIKAHTQQSALLRLQLQHSETAMDQARLTYELLNKRFSGRQLNQWLNSQLAAFYYQAYDAAHSMCLAAQACWQFERADWNTGFIQGSAWNNQFKGMTAGESLKLHLQAMNRAYLQRNQRELEISKTLSLRQLHGKDTSTTANKEWSALSQQLLTSASVDFELTKALFDADYPGHYLRRIKSVSVSLPATLGPYEDIRAILTQTWNQTQLSESPADTRENLRVREQVALSTGLSDSGLFTLNFDTDERYLPFEYTGAVSRWQLTFPNHTTQLAMLKSLNDIIVHVRYTARSAGGQQ